MGHQPIKSISLDAIIFYFSHKQLCINLVTNILIIFHFYLNILDLNVFYQTKEIHV